MSVPKLRFKEFKGKWEVKKLGEITLKVGSGSTPRGGESVYQSNGIPFIRSQNVKNESLILDELVYISDDINSHMQGSIVKSDDILLNITGASIGRSCVVPSNFKIGNVNQHVCIIRLKDGYLSSFLQPYLSSDRGQKSISSSQVGSGREGLNFQAIRLFKIFMPTIQEQTKIAEFLMAIDEKIAQLTQKCELLAQYKKGVMQKIFSQELRFKDNDGHDFADWEERTLGKTLSIFSGYAFSSNDSRLNGTKWLKIADIGIQKMTNTNPSYLPDEFRDKYKNFLVYKNDYVLALTRPILNGKLKIAKVNDSYNESLLNQRVGKLVTNQEIDFVYFILQLENTVSQISDIISGSDPPNLSLNEIKGINLNIPIDLKEQTKIANFLNSIDEKITEAQTYLDTVNQYKQGLLQQMFI